MESSVCDLSYCKKEEYSLNLCIDHYNEFISDGERRMVLNKLLFEVVDFITIKEKKHKLRRNLDGDTSHNLNNGFRMDELEMDWDILEW